MRLPRLALITAAAALALVAAGCGREGREVDSRGAELFADRCAGCHTLEAAGTEGSNPEERVAGPNLNARKETKEGVLYAIRNGGFSGAIMPQNIVVGKDAEAVAEFVAKYAGQDATAPAGLTPGGGAAEGGESGGSGGSGGGSEGSGGGSEGSGSGSGGSGGGSGGSGSGSEGSGSGSEGNSGQK